MAGLMGCRSAEASTVRAGPVLFLCLLRAFASGTLKVSVAFISGLVVSALEPTVAGSWVGPADEIRAAAMRVTVVAASRLPHRLDTLLQGSATSPTLFLSDAKTRRNDTRLPRINNY